MSPPVEKVASEVAEGELVRWAEAMDIVAKFDDAAIQEMDDDSKRDFQANKRKIVDAIRYGRLVVNEAGEFVLTQQIGPSDPITFHEPTGAAFMAMDKVSKATANVAKTFAVLAEVTGLPAQRFGAMKNRDLAVCQAIMIFLVAK